MSRLSYRQWGQYIAPLTEYYSRGKRVYTVTPRTP